MLVPARPAWGVEEPMSESRGRLAGRVAIVTGAGSGIGRAIALGYAREGARVLAADLNGPAAEETARQGGGAILAHAVDVTDEPATRAMVAAAVDWAPFGHGRLDVLVNSAAVQLHGQDGRCHEVDLDVWERTLRANLRGPFLCCKHALPELIRSRGTIVNLASPTAFGNLGAGYTAYASSKGGMATLTRVVAADYARDGVRVNAIVPGPTETGLTAQIFADPSIREPLVARTPLGRLGKPEDLVGIAVFLASEESAYATGALFFIDGGITMA
jgi:NAD(P)-dependent dehydrogenase (short-subunit alcohol dehydrogenase family)